MFNNTDHLDAVQDSMRKFRIQLIRTKVQGPGSHVPDKIMCSEIVANWKLEWGFERLDGWRIMSRP
jgi:hypothetical protein